MDARDVYKQEHENDMIALKKAKLNRPPLGLIPREFHKSHVDKERLIEVCSAIQRYYEAGLQINIEWVKEYNELCHLFKK